MSSSSKNDDKLLPPTIKGLENPYFLGKIETHQKSVTSYLQTVLGVAEKSMAALKLLRQFNQLTFSLATELQVLRQKARDVDENFTEIPYLSLDISDQSPIFRKI